jgi:hypothetical protein
MNRAHSSPALSVILPTADDFSTIRLTVRALRAQTARHRIELVIVVPSDRPHIDEAEITGFAAVKIVNAGPMQTSNKSRVAGIRGATAPIVALAEDHCFPDPDWAEALISAHQSRFAVVGPVLRNANPQSMLSWANLLLEYSPWLDGAKRCEMTDLPGHNSAYRRDLLLAFGDRLDELFEVEAVIQRELCAQGHHMLLEPRATTNHLNFSLLRPSMTLRLNAGRSFAGYRTTGWSRTKRAVYAIASPLIPLVRFARIVRFLTRSDSYRFLLPRVLPMLGIVLIVDGLGELIGYVAGPGESPRILGEIEFNRMRFLDRDDRRDLQRRLDVLDRQEVEATAMAV